MPAFTPMPQYQCHKKVWALKIKSVERYIPTIEELEETLNQPEPKTPEEKAAAVKLDDDKSVGAIITPEDARYDPFSVSVYYWHKHQPQPGGYFVQYEDGYKSYSPAEAFESGYTLITGRE